ncbi:unnamed protein product [Caenorhabditis angaria]|uniref:Uncharacterized protein n=1 Tax=Caenorhabditis angaria TaxID=860376 RepID=A0A9P1IQL1_9PELO|nr:unnamed protein product [Caenorhabditis angaria]
MVPNCNSSSNLYVSSIPAAIEAYENLRAKIPNSKFAQINLAHKSIEDFPEIFEDMKKSQNVEDEGEMIIDILWLNGNFKYRTIFEENGILAKLKITVCQLNVEIQMENARKFNDFTNWIFHHNVKKSCSSWFCCSFCCSPCSKWFNLMLRVGWETLFANRSLAEAANWPNASTETACAHCARHSIFWVTVVVWAQDGGDNEEEVTDAENKEIQIECVNSCGDTVEEWKLCAPTCFDGQLKPADKTFIQCEGDCLDRYYPPRVPQADLDNLEICAQKCIDNYRGY